MWGPHEWFRFKDPTPTDVCAVANAFQPCVLYDDDVWLCETVPHHLLAFGEYLPPSAFYVLVCDTEPFLRLNTMDLATINRVLRVLGYNAVSTLQPVYKVNKSS